MTISIYDGAVYSPDTCDTKKVKINTKGGFSHLYTSSEWMVLFATAFTVESERTGLTGAVDMDYLYAAYHRWVGTKR